MSQENVEVVRAAFEALIRGDLRTLLDSIDPEIEWDATAYPPGLSAARKRSGSLRKNRGAIRSELARARSNTC